MPFDCSIINGGSQISAFWINRCLSLMYWFWFLQHFHSRGLNTTRKSKSFMWTFRYISVGCKTDIAGNVGDYCCIYHPLHSVFLVFSGKSHFGNIYIYSKLIAYVTHKNITQDFNNIRSTPHHLKMFKTIIEANQWKNLTTSKEVQRITHFQFIWRFTVGHSILQPPPPPPPHGRG